jgi:dihydroorotate dehydrogenase (NAD+) catalytic subunit
MKLGDLTIDPALMNAAGTLSVENLEEEARGYGALVTKTVTLEPRAGNPPPRIAETPCGMVNSIGLQNPGIERFLEEELDKWCAAPGLPVIVSIGGENTREYGRMCEMIASDERVAAVELNLSCPNVAGGTYRPQAIGDIVDQCRQRLGRTMPLIAKLGLEGCREAALHAEYEEAYAITLINTVPALSFEGVPDEPLLGGLSGPAIKPIALRAVYKVSRIVDIPIIGCGGIASVRDEAEFVWAGASAVQVGSCRFVGKASPGEVPAELEKEGTN